jgi:NTE family protein
MATKNILFILILWVLIGCESMGVKTRRSDPVEIPDHDKVSLEKPAAAEAPEFLKKEAPKLGLILSGGGALSYAHIGLIHELEKQKVPIQAIAGMEWGALVAASYAVEGKANATEWKLLKLPAKSFISKSFFSSSKGGASLDDFKSFLNTVFKDNLFSDTEIPFACPFTDLSKGNNSLRRSGKIRYAVRSCWGSEPHFKIGSAGANSLDISGISRFLKSKGAELIVMIDVESPNPWLSKKQRQDNPSLALYEISRRSAYELYRKPFVDEVIQIKLPGYQINSYESLRSIIRTGQVKSKNAVKTLVKKYAF